MLVNTMELPIQDQLQAVSDYGKLKGVKYTDYDAVSL